jgi:hypothetical protein
MRTGFPRWVSDQFTDCADLYDSGNEQENEKKLAKLFHTGSCEESECVTGCEGDGEEG